MNPRGTAAGAVSRAAPRPVPAPPALGPTPTTPLPRRECGARARVTPCGAEEAATQRRSAGSRGSPPHSRSRQHLRTRVPAARRLGSSTAPGTGASRASYLTGSWVEAARTHGAPNALQQNLTQTRAFNRRRHRQGQKRAQRGREVSKRPAPARDPAPARPRLFLCLPSLHVRAPPLARRVLLTGKRVLRSQGPLGPYVSANPTLRGDRLRQDPESETGVGDLPDPVTTLVLLHSRLPLAYLKQ
ncbi:putative hydro-lyase KRH_21160 [Pan troglodytes]|uniref:putative hydro-lyase KRH_21160 n=1 Tax=Pan troglodytes TaxID=9598 RepID=UPI003013E2D6